MFLRNVGIYLRVYMASQPRRTLSSSLRTSNLMNDYNIWRCLSSGMLYLGDNGGTKHLWNVGQYLPHYMVQRRRNLKSRIKKVGHIFLLRPTKNGTIECKMSNFIYITPIYSKCGKTCLKLKICETVYSQCILFKALRDGIKAWNSEYMRRHYSPEESKFPRSDMGSNPGQFLGTVLYYRLSKQGLLNPRPATIFWASRVHFYNTISTCMLKIVNWYQKTCFVDIISIWQYLPLQVRKHRRSSNKELLSDA
jgi:hypothetical protein